MRHRAVQSLREGQAVSRSTGGNLHMEMKATTRTTHQQVQSQDRHQAVRTPPGPRHGWRSGIGATTGHRRATGPPIEAEAVTRSTRTRPGGIALWSRYPPDTETGIRSTRSSPPGYRGRQTGGKQHAPKRIGGSKGGSEGGGNFSFLDIQSVTLLISGEVIRLHHVRPPAATSITPDFPCLSCPALSGDSPCRIL